MVPLGGRRLGGVGLSAGTRHRFGGSSAAQIVRDPGDERLVASIRRRRNAGTPGVPDGTIARFRGADFRVYGNGSQWVAECVGCGALIDRATFRVDVEEWATRHAELCPAMTLW